MLTPFMAPLYKGIGSILMFHRIVDSSSDRRIHNQAIEVSTEQLKKIIQFFLDRNYDVIRMSELEERFKTSNKQPFVVFTFDDGYEDNYTKAFPVFKQFDIPFTIYVTSNMPEHKLLLWNYMLEDYLLDVDECQFMYEGRNYSFGNSIDQKEEAFASIKNILNGLGINGRLAVFKSITSYSDLQIASKTKELSLSWEQIKEMHASGLVEIGAHTVNHPALNKLTKEEFFQEVNGSKEAIESKIGAQVDHFAFPFGSINEIDVREIDLMKKTNFKTSVTTRIGNIQKGHREHIYALPRLDINDRTTEEDLIRYISGRFNYLGNAKNITVTI